MSKYTISMLEIVRMYTPESKENISKRIEYALPEIFNFDFPIFKESHRKELEKKIVMHYLNKEIGLETPYLFKIYLEMKLNEIMPYYNEMYRIAEELSGINLLEDVNLYDDFSGNETQINTNSETSSNSMNFAGSVENSENETDTGNAKNEENVTDNSTSTKEFSNTSKGKNSKNTETSNSNSVTLTGSENTENNNSKNTTTSTSSDTILSDFPQGNLKNADYASGSSTLTGSNNSSDSEENTTTKTTNQTNSTTGSENSSETNTHEESSTGSENNKLNSTTIKKSNIDSKNVKNLTGETITENNTTSENTRNDNFNGEKNNTSQLHKHGLSGSHTVASMIMEYRQAIMNVDMMIISELSDLFIKIY